MFPVARCLQIEESEPKKQVLQQLYEDTWVSSKQPTLQNNVQKGYKTNYS